MSEVAKLLDALGGENDKVASTLRKQLTGKRKRLVTGLAKAKKKLEERAQRVNEIEKEIANIDKVLAETEPKPEEATASAEAAS